MPQTTAPAVLQVSPQFKTEATKAIVSIILFIVVYFLMIAISVALAIGSFYAGIRIMSAASFIALITGAGIIGAGVMIFVFLIKFIFAISKVDNSDSIEVTEEDHPELFRMIYELADEIGTPRPKKVFLSADVNASVSYNSSFWSMFFPVRKNLRIGLGLVNSVNASELRAVIAHEFGHFSQRSMKVGSWVYQVNKIIHDMLFNNDSYGKTLSSASNLHGIIAIFASITIGVVRGIQWILGEIYKIVNRQYLSLSREMEFHADLVAASVAGGNNIISSLRRVELADFCFNSTINMCNDIWIEKKMVKDFYSAQSTMLRRVAELNKMQLVDGLPLPNNKNAEFGNRINFKNQWASHPTLHERDQHVSAHDLSASVDGRSAWIYFKNHDRWRADLTNKIYNESLRAEAISVIDEREFDEFVVTRFKKYELPAEFGEYYDNRSLEEFDVDAAIKKEPVAASFNEVFSDRVMKLPKMISQLTEEIATVEAIINKQIDTRTFDFEGRKYKAREAQTLWEQLKSEKEKLTAELKVADELMFRFFHHKLSAGEADKLRDYYTEYFKLRHEQDQFMELTTNISALLAPIYGPGVSIESVNVIVDELKNEKEDQLKKVLREWKEKGVFDSDPTTKASVEKFLASNYVYFHSNSFMNNELQEINMVRQAAWESIAEVVFEKLKNILLLQVQERKGMQNIES